MAVTALDPRTALVVIDLQKGIAAYPTVHPARDVVANSARLAEAFRAAWAKGNGGAKPRAAKMDETLHRERLEGGQKRLHSLPAAVGALPDGAMLAVDNAAYLIAGGKALLWSPLTSELVINRPRGACRRAGDDHHTGP